MYLKFLPAGTDVSKEFREKEKKYIVIDHELEAGETVPEDVHGYNEWIFLGPGTSRCEVMVGGQHHPIDFDPSVIVVVSVPIGTKHSFKAITDISYTVMKDGDD